MVTTPTPFSIAEVSSISGECGNGSTSSGPVDIGYPDKMDSLVDELVEEGYGEEAAEELIFDTQEWV